jgi:MFS-type transporter involved in bile tolerance (Atg22 family)
VALSAPYLGAVAVAGITQSTRLAILALIFFFVIGALLLATVDVERGRKLALKG